LKSLVFDRFYDEIPYQVGVGVKGYSEMSDGTIKIVMKLDVSTHN